MQKKRNLILAAAVAVALYVVPTFAQQTDAPKPMTAQGQLVRVDSAAKTISIRTQTDTELVFTYTDATKVTGDKDDVAGLATVSGTPVSVTYNKRGQENIALAIDVQKKPAR